MRLVAISAVRNEQDIVEAFVRHTASFVDHHLILNNGSTDHTPEILEQLMGEGVSLSVIDDPGIGFWQSERTTGLMHQAATEFDGDWVLPLDADEFLSTSDVSLRDLLEARSEPVLVTWRSYVPDTSDDPADVNPVSRIRHRLATEGREWSKVLVPATFARHGVLLQGNHDVSVGGVGGVIREVLESVHLCHFPIRSAEQHMAKIAIGNLQYLAKPVDREGFGFHYIRPFDQMVQDWRQVAQSFAQAARVYSMTEADMDGFEPEIVLDPMNYAGGALRYTDGQRVSEPWGSLLEYAVQLAQRVAELERLRDSESDA